MYAQIYIDPMGHTAKHNWSPRGLYSIQVHDITCVIFRFGRVWKCNSWKQMNQHVSSLGKTTKGLCTGANVMLRVWLVYLSRMFQKFKIIEVFFVAFVRTLTMGRFFCLLLLSIYLYNSSPSAGSLYSHNPAVAKYFRWKCEELSGFLWQHLAGRRWMIQ